MTDKELHRLSRRELLQLLLTQAKDTEELRQLSEDRGEQLESLRENYERLKKRLDDKDAQIDDLRATLRQERTNRRIELNEAGSIAEAALRLNGIFEMAQRAAEQYLYNIRLLHEKEAAYAEKYSIESEQMMSGKAGPETERAEGPEVMFPEDMEEILSEPGTEDMEEMMPEPGTGDPEETEPEQEPGTEDMEEAVPEPWAEGLEEIGLDPEIEDPEEAVPETEKRGRWFRGGKRRAKYRK